MTIEEELTTRLKEAMREKKTSELSVLRMVKSLAGKEKTAPDFSGETDDKFWLSVIGKYVKQQKKALEEFEKLGEAAKKQVDEARFEIEYLKPFLPQQLTEKQISEIVDRIIADTGAAGPSMIGRIVGAVMKDHKDEVDAAVVKEIAAKKLG